ncbi:aminoglycoside phosphotransferase family protein [Streptomyces celluloflavus]|uniref:Aminoglycoside phosphotransferase domain-containing protein n=1 Tax=Streptomyces celluloflavus TaxID=58344 RepID=A0ABW7R7L5_9ACTN|nr:aminoglycoside phosphotransferase family protein [Streptomyces celluloflavus]
MNLPPDEATRALMEAAHRRAAEAIGLTCTGPMAWGFAGFTLGRRSGSYWLRVSRSLVKNAGRKHGQGIVGANLLVPRDVPRPALHGTYDWAQGEYAFEAEVLDLVEHPVLSPQSPDLVRNPALPEQWWELLRRALDRLAEADGAKETVRDEWIERAFPQFLGIPAPSNIERVTGHGDLHWGNLTGMPLTLLDWERWGRVPAGYDPGLLHAYSLRVPLVATRIRSQFATVLDTPAGRIGELAALAEMLQAVARGFYPKLAPLLLARTEELTGVRPPVSVPAEVTA